ncbi:MAG: hypothetical protein KF691_14125 [Phycisphaeraceae bacterium]|nr:hypothetical protein [Phycisphaeraceae bacterium]
MKIGAIGILAATLGIGSLVASVCVSREPAPAKSAPAADNRPKGNSDNLRTLLDTFRSDSNATKIRVLNQALKLTPEEAAKFWPVYQKYEKELNSVIDRRIALIRKFVTLSNEGGLDNANAAMLSTEWLQGEQDRLDLWKKYNKEIGAAVSPIRAAQFLQVEHQIALLMDLDVASQMPAVTGAK